MVVHEACKQTLTRLFCFSGNQLTCLLISVEGYSIGTLVQPSWRLHGNKKAGDKQDVQIKGRSWACIN